MADLDTLLPLVLRKRKLIGEGAGIDRERLIAIDEAVAQFGVSRRTLWRWLQVGLLERYRVVGDRRTLVDIQALQTLLRPHASVSRRAGR